MKLVYVKPFSPYFLQFFQKNI